MPSLPLLMALRVKGRGTAAAVAAAAGLGTTDAEAALASACTSGDAVRIGDRVALSDAGHAALDTLLAGEAIDRNALAARYGDFLAIDARVKQRVTAWQLAHTRAADTPTADGNGVLAPIRAVAAEAHAVVVRIAAIVARHGVYLHRLAAARDALAAGDARYVASPAVDSLHQVWFELHEDLLLTLGRERQA